MGSLLTLAVEGPKVIAPASGWFLENAWIIALLPAISFVLILFFGKRMPKKGSEIGIAAVAIAFVLAVLTAGQWINQVDTADERVPKEDKGEEALGADVELAAGEQFALPAVEEGEEISVGVDAVVQRFTWWENGGQEFQVGIMVDGLTVMMLFVVTAISLLVHVYSTDYVDGDRRYTHYFAFLSLFTASMLFFVLSENVLQMIVGWELVGVCSFALIGHWWEEKPNSDAALKAFLTNRVGDMGLLIGMIILFWSASSWSIIDINKAAIGHDIGQTTLFIASLCLTAAVMSKSGQFILHTWLPDAMAGPTPVSALIHAATMVTSGVYLLTRMNPVLAEAADWAPSFIAWVGLFTALFAATIAVAQNDIKKVLAYSTVSQLGFMFVALGSGLYVAAIFHMITHAFFKALLFLGAGSVIHGMDDEQDMRRYGALAKAMPITAGTFIIGWLAISGVPPFSGFWSKDEVLLAAYNENFLLWVLLLIAAVMTAFYMSRLVFMTFFGEARWDAELDDAPAEAADEPDDHADEAADHHGVHPHESPWTMWLPLVALAGLAIVAGLLNLPFSSDLKFLEHWLEPVLFGNEVHVDASGGTKWVLAIIAVIGGAVGIIGAFAIYMQRRLDPKMVEQPLLARGWRYDEAVTDFMGGPGRRFFDLVAWFDRTIIDGAVNGASRVTALVGTRMRTIQTGLVRTYALAVVLGTVALVVYFLARTTF